MTTPRRTTGVRIPADKIAAARLMVKLGDRLNDPAPDWVRRLAAHGRRGRVMTPEEGGLYYVRSRTSDCAEPDLAQFRAGEFLFFGTDDNAYPADVDIIMKVAVVEA